MSRYLGGKEVAERIARLLPEAVVDVAPQWVVVDPTKLLAVGRLLKDDPELDCRYLISLTAVDRIDHFDLVYHLASLAKNHVIVVKARLLDREKPEAPSLTAIWRAADLQECEVYDLMGIRFSGHPSLRRDFLWEGFAGYPLRKDYLNMPGGVKPGLPLFPGVRPDEEGAVDG